MRYLRRHKKMASFGVRQPREPSFLTLYSCESIAYIEMNWNSEPNDANSELHNRYFAGFSLGFENTEPHFSNSEPRFTLCNTRFTIGPGCPIRNQISKPGFIINSIRFTNFGLLFAPYAASGAGCCDA